MSFQEMFEYRMNFVWQTIGTIITTLMLYLFWTAILSSNSGKFVSFPIGSYYLFISISGAITLFSFRPFAEDIWEGYLTIHLLRPYNYFAAIFLNSLPEKIVSLLVSILVICIAVKAGAVSFLNVRVVIAFLVSLVFAGSVKFYISSIIGALAFWFKRVHGFNALLFNLGGLFSGELIPLIFLPSKAALISLYLPFRYIAYFPVQLILGQASSREVLSGFIVLILWFLLFYIINRILWKKGISQFEATGR